MIGHAKQPKAIVEFQYMCRKRPPHFVPVCTKCGLPIENVEEATLVLGSDGSEGAGLFHWGCDDFKGIPWLNFAEALCALVEGQHPKQRRKAARYDHKR